MDGMSPNHRMTLGLNVVVCSRTHESQEALSAATIALEISSRNPRVAAIQKRWDLAARRPRAGPRSAGCRHGRSARWRERIALPGLQGEGSQSAGDPHRPRRGLAGRRTVRPRAPAGRGSRAANAGVQERKPLDASPAAITLALLLTGEELGSLEKRAGDGEIARGGRPGGAIVASTQPAARHGEPAQLFPANAAPADGRRRVDGVIGR